MTQTKAELRAKNKYNKSNTRTYCLRLNLKTDSDIIEILDSVTSKQGFIKELIRLNEGNLDEYGIYEKYAKYPRFIIDTARLRGVDPGELDTCTILGDTSLCTLASGDCSKCIRSKVMKAAEKAETKKS